jgi:hypothetical protein
VIVRPYLNHSFQNVRERLGSILTNIFEADLQFAGAAAPECPRIRDFIDEMMPKMTVLLTESPVVKTGMAKIAETEMGCLLNFIFFRRSTNGS